MNFGKLINYLNNFAVTSPFTYYNLTHHPFILRCLPIDKPLEAYKILYFSLSCILINSTLQKLKKIKSKLYLN